MRVLFGFLLAALSVTGFAATFVFGGALTKSFGVSAEVLSFLRFAIAGGMMLAVLTAELCSRGLEWMLY